MSFLIPHGTGAVPPAVAAVGSIGVATTGARSDHTHSGVTTVNGAAGVVVVAAFPGFGGVPPAVGVVAGSAGVAATASRSDHTHSVNVLAPLSAASRVVFNGAAGATQGASNLIARADHTHESPQFTSIDENRSVVIAPAVTPLVDGQTTGLAVSSPTASIDAADNIWWVYVNGIKYEVGDGVKTQACYFSGNGGVTARAFGAIVNADILYWNGIVTGFNLEAGIDVVDIVYQVFN